LAETKLQPLALPFWAIYMMLLIYGFAHLRFSILPVFGHRISCQDTGSSVAPAEYQYISVKKV
jgi:hypothetical protein